MRLDILAKTLVYHPTTTYIKYLISSPNDLSFRIPNIYLPHAFIKRGLFSHEEISMGRFEHYSIMVREKFKISISEMARKA